ncbi:DNA replication ATP-dependent helicase Dna2 [Cladophialophora psammophila CBS 110553]|uniref:DNA replication ATP-dependent helicase/nuclease n=1 Tax=Cladophialophora psammophila CBS 110553 TaxID=1182543 RepID=W9XCS6_9EURO|nr:DNA replication ATP-dependent helicase Dna2 [Cladophialophora psammophila CBS 110553]EXJ68239.1 DNA replication ATP-dependent helicase Dna2 [Cladophialophora psammophila CBS 110553]
MPSASSGVSSQSRRKLKAFAFDERLLASDEDKENQKDQKNTLRKPESDDPDLLRQHEVPEPRVPHTPAVRIPIEDLIANTEDAYNCTPPINTPKDHVLWQTHPDSSDVSIAAGATQRSRKRAHSSSPFSSQQLSVHKDALNLDALNKSLRTPNNDPTQDLWNRYTNANGLKKDAKEPTLPSHIHLLPSSPQTPSTTSKDSGLRRTHSCGIEWPTSKAKRRKVETTAHHSRTKELFAASRKDILRRDLPNNTRVGLLLERIQESLTKKVDAAESPSSSSPLPDRRSQAFVSPTKPTNRIRQVSDGLVDTARSPRKVPSGKVAIPSEISFSSEFSDDGLDIEAFESVEWALEQAEAKDKTSHVVSNHNENGLNTRPNIHSYDEARSLQLDGSRDQRGRPQNENDELILQSEHTATEFDEFDDDDDDEELMNEMLDLAAQYDSPSQAVATKPQAPGKPTSGTNPQSKYLETLDEFQDAFDDDDDFWEDIANATCGEGRTPIASKDHTSIDNRAIKRYLIMEVFESEYEYKPGRRRPEKVLSVKDERSGMCYIILLRESWYDTRCTKGSYVHVIGKFGHTGQCIVNDADNMIILHPDHLISSTVVGDSFTCMRRAVLQDRVKATSAASQPQVYGHILHEVFGRALRINKWDMQSFREIVDKTLSSYIESLYEIGVRVQDATEYLLGKTPELMAWASVFVGDTLSADALIRDRNGLLVPATVNKLLELEEHIWSPMYGLKGNIDATVQVQMKLPHEQSPRTLLVPFELKTGKKDNVEQHRVQTALYTLLLSDRYDIVVTCGVLYYMETSKTYRVEGIRNEIRHMIIQRNELACFVHDKLALPPMIKKQHLCKSCYSKAACFTYHKLSENGTTETSGLGEKFSEVVDHLSAAHQSFFKKWDDLLTKEERDTMKFRRELWTMLSSEREAVGRCFSEVVIQPGSAFENPESSKINRFEYTFVKHMPRPGFSFRESQITTGEPIVISDEKGHFNFAAGFVTNVQPSRVVVAVDRRLERALRKWGSFDPVTNQVFSSHVNVTEDGNSPSSQPDGPILYRIDKDEFANGMATARNNILRMMEKDLWRARELRQLIIENKRPDFKASSTAYTLSGPASQQNLNVDQQRAIEKVMAAKDYALVLGMPGTGKTTTIAHIIRALVSQGKSVLLASYTHTAVDNILLKIKDDNIPVLRIGAANKVHPEVQSFADISGLPKRTTEELHISWHESKIVATTCLSVNHGIFNARTFDYCIVDEASQITLPVCLGPIRMARTFILVGDHYQLPPLVQNKQALEGGLDVSLFKLLSDAQPDSVVNLEHQYRMAEDIMLLSRELVYSGRIKCGSEAVAGRMLEIPDLDGGVAAHHFTASSLAKSSPQTVCLANAGCWLRRALSPSSRCLFLNTDSIIPSGVARETVTGARITNNVEAILTAQLVTTLIHAGVAPRSIGVITFYRSQLAVLRTDVRAFAGSVAAGEVEMHTADKYQGRDKEVVILSCVRSNESHHVGDLLKDWRRVNVAVTRARSKLLLVGSKSTLEGSGVPILEGLTRIMEQKGWVLEMPGEACEMHCFESAITQTNGRTAQICSAGGLVGAQEARGSSPSPSAQKKWAMKQASEGNSAYVSPRKKQKQGTSRKPDKVVRGTGLVGGPDGGLQKLLDKRPVLRDVLNELVGDGCGNELDKENINLDADPYVDMDMDADFDPVDFGVY